MNLNVVNVKLEKQATIEIPKEAVKNTMQAAGIFDSYMQKFTSNNRENTVLLCLDALLYPAAIHTLATGMLDKTEFSVMEVARVCMLCNSQVIVLAHNHPSGSATPSDTDIATTKKLMKACKLLGIQVLDHLVFGEDECCSMKMLNLI